MAKRKKITLALKREYNKNPSGESAYARRAELRKTQIRGPAWCPGCFIKLSRAACRCTEATKERARAAASEPMDEDAGIDVEAAA